MGPFTVVMLLFSVVTIITLFSVFHKPSSPKVEDLDDDTLVDEDGWEYRLRLGQRVYKNGPRKFNKANVEVKAA